MDCCQCGERAYASTNQYRLGDHYAYGHKHTHKQPNGLGYCYADGNLKTCLNIDKVDK